MKKYKGYIQTRISPLMDEIDVFTSKDKKNWKHIYTGFRESVEIIIEAFIKIDYKKLKNK